jgi:hypothetical protein
MDILVILSIVVVVAVVAYLLIRNRRTGALKSKFGPEYDHALGQAGHVSRAEAELREREKRVKTFDIRPLPPPQREAFIDYWERIQADFVDDPHGAVTRADALLGDVMSARGYPVSDFETRSADLSVDHPQVVQHYRAGHDIAVRHARGEADTEDLRQAMIHYRALFADLIDDRAEARR